MEKSTIERTVYDLLVGECEIEECLIPNVQENLDLLPSNVDLAEPKLSCWKLRIRRYSLSHILKKSRKTMILLL